MRTVTVKFTANKRNYTSTFEWLNPQDCANKIRKIYKDLGIKKATNQRMTLSDWNFWAGYVI